MIFVFLSQPSAAQLVPCAGVYPTYTAASFPVGSIAEDVVVNTDMMMYSNGTDMIKAIAYSKRNYAPAWSGDEAHVFVEDWAGNSVTINLAPGASRADVALADWKNASIPLPPGAPINYRLVVAYQVSTLAYFDIWQINDCGTPSMSATKTFTQLLSKTPGRYCDTFHNGPHIDTWTDVINKNAANNEPSVHKFAIVWTEGPIVAINPLPYPPPAVTTVIAADTLLYYINDLDAFSPLVFPVNLGGGAQMPDVACLADLITHNEYLEIAYTNFSRGDMLYHLEYPLASPPVPTSSSTSTLAVKLDSGQVFRFPRIEALSNWWSKLTYTKWQITTIKGGFPTGLPSPAFSNQAVSYDNTGTSHWLSNGYLGEQVISPCVAAGSGIDPASGGGGGLWSNRYFSGFFPWTSDHVLTRTIHFATHILDPQWWEVNAAPFSYPWDAARSFHISTCSNSLLHLLSAWYDGGSVLYKTSLTTAPLAFKQPTLSTSTTPLPTIKYRLSPNPATSTIMLDNVEKNSEYLIQDFIGKTVAEGYLTLNNTIDISSLLPGQYAITIVKLNGHADQIKFVKQ